MRSSLHKIGSLIINKWYRRQKRLKYFKTKKPQLTHLIRYLEKHLILQKLKKREYEKLAGLKNESLSEMILEMISKQEKIFTGISKLVAIESTSIAKHVESFLSKEFFFTIIKKI